MTFLEVLAVLAAVVVLIASALVVTTLSPRRWERAAARAGLASVGAGAAVFLALSLITLNYYDEQPRQPSWLTAVGVVALVLAGGGLLAVVSAIVAGTIRAARGSPGRRV